MAGSEPVLIRRAAADDAGRLAELCGQLGYPALPGQVQPRLTEILQDEGNVVSVAVRPDGQIVGWVQVYERQLLMVDRHVEMGGLVVDEEYRDRGIGRLLVDWAETWARERGCKALYLRSNVDREAAHHFYARLGYQLVKTQRAYQKAVTDQDGAGFQWAPEPGPGGTQVPAHRP